MDPTSDALQAFAEAIPHRPPMLLLDQMIEKHSDSIICEKTFVADEFFFQGHYPGHPIVPGVILCECAMQAGAVLLSEQVQGQAGIPVATRLNEVKFKRMVSPGETVRIEVKLNERLGDAFFLTGKVTCEGKLAARLEFACALTSPPRSDG